MDSVSDTFDPGSWKQVPGFEDLQDITYHRAVDVGGLDHGRRARPIVASIVDLAHAVDLDEDAPLAVDVDQRLGLLEVDLLPAPDDVLGVVRAAVGLRALQQALDEPVPLAALLRECADLLALLQRPLRHLLNYHCGVGAFRTRQMMLDIQSL